MKEALTFDDVLLVPQLSSVLPREVDVKTRLTKKVNLDLISLMICSEISASLLDNVN